MANKQNYALMMDELIDSLQGRRPPLLLHACCGPCSSSVLEQLCRHFKVTILYYNPNIWPPAEFERRQSELERFLHEIQFPDVILVKDSYDPADFYTAVQGLESEPEKGNRCTVCYRLRQKRAAEYAATHGFEWFTTTLSVSPLKDPVRLNAIGAQLAEEYGLHYLTSEFRKRDGYKRSLELSREYHLYRQQYCGCEFSAIGRGFTTAQEAAESGHV